MKGLVAVLLGLTLGSCGSSGGADPKDLFPGQFPATKAECVSQGTSDCAMPCASGETYHGDQAQLCTDALNKLSCSSLSDPNVAFPASCQLICSGP